MIIIEGVDNSGKSTLAMKLSQRLRIDLYRDPKPEGLSLANAHRRLRPIRAIHDRCYAISDYIYGSVLRDGPALGELHSDVILDLLTRNYLIIYCRPHSEAILNNAGRDQMDGVLDNHQKLIDEYDNFMQNLRRFGACTVIDYNWKSDSFDLLVEKVKKYFQKFEEARTTAEYLVKFKGKEHASTS